MDVPISYTRITARYTEATVCSIYCAVPKSQVPTSLSASKPTQKNYENSANGNTENMIKNTRLARPRQRRCRQQLNSHAFCSSCVS